MEYVFLDDAHRKEMKLIFGQMQEGIPSKKYSREPHGTIAMKPFKNNENDRILCTPLKRIKQNQCIVMAEIYLQKKTDGNDKRIITRYKIISRYNYEIIE